MQHYISVAIGATFLVLFCSLSPIARAQSTPHKIILVNQSNEDKTRKLPLFKNYEITMKDVDRSNGTSFHCTIFGKPVAISTDSLRIDMLTKHTSTSTETKYVVSGIEEYSKDTSTDSIRIQWIAKEDIYAIETYPAGYEVISSLGFAAIVTAVLAAPVASIDYKDGNFNQKRYLTTVAVGSGLAGLLIGWSELWGTKRFALDYHRNHKKLWRIE